MSAEQMARNLLSLAIKEQLVIPNPFRDDPQDMSASDLIAVANLISEYLTAAQLELHISMLGTTTKE